MNGKSNQILFEFNMVLKVNEDNFLTFLKKKWKK